MNIMRYTWRAEVQIFDNKLFSMSYRSGNALRQKIMHGGLVRMLQLRGSTCFVYLNIISGAAPEERDLRFDHNFW